MGQISENWNINLSGDPLLRRLQENSSPPIAAGLPAMSMMGRQALVITFKNTMERARRKAMQQRRYDVLIFL
jgi:hypothetical protein